MYTNVNFKTKKALKEAVEAGKQIGVYQPNDMRFSPTPENGVVAVEGPHYPQAHTWYAQVTLKDSVIVKVK